jgi:hypothetical protein
MDGIFTVHPQVTPWNLANLCADTDEEKANFLDPQNLYAYRRKMESASNGIFKNLVFDETAPEVRRNMNWQQLI